MTPEGHDRAEEMLEAAISFAPAEMAMMVGGFGDADLQALLDAAQLIERFTLGERDRRKER